MPRRYHGLNCKVCGRHVNDCGTLSTRGKCADCGLGLAVMGITEMRKHTGGTFHKWRQNMAGCVGGVLVDDHPERE
jgi:hypothetical protein